MKQLLVLLFLLPCMVTAGEFTVTQRNGKYCFLIPDGRPVMLLGISHIWGGIKVPGGKDTIVKDLLDCRFNAIGYALDFVEGQHGFMFIHNADKLPGSPKVSPNAPASAFEDVFDPALKEKLRKQIAGICKQTVGNPHCVGYWWTDIPTWGGGKGDARNAFVDFFRKLPPTAPGRKRYEQFLAQDGDHGDLAFLRLVARETIPSRPLAIGKWPQAACCSANVTIPFRARRWR